MTQESWWWKFFDNESLGAAVGAFLAFFLFFLTHAIIGFFKNRRIHKKLIPALLVIAQDLCARKILTVTSLLAGSRNNPPTFTSAPIMPFEVAELEALQAQCLWHFGNIEKRAFCNLFPYEGSRRHPSWRSVQSSEVERRQAPTSGHGCDAGSAGGGSLRRRATT